MAGIAARTQGGPLVEREAELGRLADLADAANTGRGSAVVVQGPAGIGKSSLLEEAGKLADERGLRRLGARGGELERDFAYGVIRQVFEPAVAGHDQVGELFDGPAAAAAAVLGVAAPGDEATLAGSDPAGAAVHGLYWLTANLAGESPLLLSVDDLHWTDTASMRFVAYLARRVSELPVLLVTATRPTVEAHAPELVERFMSDRAVRRLEPPPLTEGAVRELLRSELGDEASDELGRACHRATGGNPLFVRAVARALDEDGGRMDAAMLPDAGSGAIGRSVELQLSNLGADARQLARALAVLGAAGELRHAAGLAELSEPRAAEAADALVAAGILKGIRPLEFSHPILRSAVYGEIRPADRAQRHLAAARLLDADADEPERVAPHLLAAARHADPWVVESLRHAAARSMERGAPEAAIRSMQRALEEPPPPEARAEVLAELGRAELASGPNTDAVEHLAAALNLTREPRAAAQLALEVATAQSSIGRWVEGVATLEPAVESVRDADPELSRKLRAYLVMAAGFDTRTHTLWREHLDRLSADMPDETASDRLLLVALAVGHLLLGGDGSVAVDAAGRAVDGGLIREQSGDSTFALNACVALALGGDFERCDRALREAFVDVRERGSLFGFARMSVPAAMLRLQQGALAEAEGHARDTFNTSRERGYTIEHLAHGLMLEIQVERGTLTEEAERLVPEGDVPDQFMHNWLLYGRGRLRLARGQTRAAIEDLEELGRREEKWRGRNPALFAYRSSLARAWQIEGETERARDLVQEELKLARAWGAAGPLGRALRRLAEIEEPAESVDLLRESLDVLDGSGYQLEHATALVALGSALRRSRRRADSREPLYEGMELAHRCGAMPLVERAREELVATGARPRRPIRTGVDALTPSELRVARMAAEGQTNREIAAALFVTSRTVEVHLTHAYQKLDISSREELPKALTEG